MVARRHHGHKFSEVVSERARAFLQFLGEEGGGVGARQHTFKHGNVLGARLRTAAQSNASSALIKLSVKRVANFRQSVATAVQRRIYRQFLAALNALRLAAEHKPAAVKHSAVSVRFNQGKFLSRGRNIRYMRSEKSARKGMYCAGSAVVRRVNSALAEECDQPSARIPLRQHFNSV